MTDDEHREYVGLCPECNRLIAVACETLPKKELAKSVADWLRRGLNIVRWTLAEVKTSQWGHGDNCSLKAKDKKTEGQAMTDDELRKLAEAATGGKWSADAARPGPGAARVAKQRVTSDVYYPPVIICQQAMYECGGLAQSAANLDYIAAVHPQALLEILDRLQRAEAALRTIRDELPGDRIREAAIVAKEALEFLEET